MPNEAKSHALRWLSQRSLTVWEVRERLKRRGCLDEEIDEVLAELHGLNFLDDRRVAEEVLRQGLARHQGPRHLLSRMAQRGIPRHVMGAAMEELNGMVDWLEIAEPLRQRYDRSSPRGRARFIRHLVREGFPSAVIQRLIQGDGSDMTDGVEDY